MTHETETQVESLSDSVTHMLEECRMVLPGIQALFGCGFQLDLLDEARPPGAGDSLRRAWTRRLFRGPGHDARGLPSAGEADDGLQTLPDHVHKIVVLVDVSADERHPAGFLSDRQPDPGQPAS